MSRISISECVDWFKNCQFIAGTPRRITPGIRSFCEQIEAEPPVFVAVTPTAEAEHMRCFKNVADVIDDGSGEMQTGWLIWELPGIYLCGERHAVVKYGDQFVDVTPQPDGQRRILFAPTVHPPTDTLTPNQCTPLRDSLAVAQDVSPGLPLHRNSEVSSLMKRRTAT